MPETMIKQLIRSGRTVFRTEDIAMISGESDFYSMNNRISYYLKTDQLVLLRRGIYALDQDYDVLELANRINIPSYISCQSVLTKSGCIFQFYPQVFLLSYLTREITIADQKFIFKKIKDEVLFNPVGIYHGTKYSIATRERAFLDMVYLYPSFYFDNLQMLDWGSCFDMVEIYDNKSMLKRLNSYYKEQVNA